MQTFLAYPSFSKSASILDNRRLNKQIVEAKQILLANLTGPRQGLVELYPRKWERQDPAKLYHVVRPTPWYNHPATKLWRGYERHLCLYALCCCAEAKDRGIKVSLEDFFFTQYRNLPSTPPPSHIGYEPYHASHRSNLKRKDPIHYGHFPEPPTLPYVWTIPSSRETL